ncbi:hypothetical protein TTHERM_00490570 (macronuclear) [Tetrahymena thermophila SB210]|uniref:Uncharacterized protein n=1 Tax=Tetrahymena thermophila (strain SB210) TaxID=312017 RepID=Q23JB5_TETTS|nr:hypothetical protein TTHERM_00490570 [Tetrahymena thermophila SB210]EAR96589.2 hypothetical protein TTHERM_00490570 [Tetrahymena thermophila SB210]|eukprot:XP_001016834.2 hypothetical protein TTHERM_00490570 [Tetrahymena thermophila SB210]
MLINDLQLLYILRDLLIQCFSILNNQIQLFYQKIINRLITDTYIQNNYLQILPNIKLIITEFTVLLLCRSIYQIIMQNILPEIKNQSLIGFQNKIINDIKPQSSYQPQRQAQKNFNYPSQSKQLKIDEFQSSSMKNGQKLSLGNIKDQQFQEEINDLMQIQAQQEQRAARNIEKHFKKVIPNAQHKPRNLSESSGVGRLNINQQNNQNMQNYQNIDLNSDEIGLFVPTNIEKLKGSIKNDILGANKKEQSQNKKIKEQQRSFTSNQKQQKSNNLQKSVIIQEQQQQPQPNSLKNHKDFILKRQRIRGPQGVNIKVVEMWINDTICEAESEVQPNQTKLNSPQKKQNDQKEILKNFGLDRKSLQNKGVSKENIDRIYRSLFVYSFGFYEMIQDIFAHIQDSAQTIASVWKIYGILLEYCSRTDFVNTVTQLEKEKTAIVDNLEEQIESKQKQFDELEVIEKEKREILEQQILSLKQEKQNILTEKFQLEEDFKQADQAFNEEVGLRLQFEHKINELHSIHRELLMKHNRLIDDYDSLKIDHEILKNDNENNNKLINTLKVLEQKKSDECRDFQRKVNEITVQFEKLKERAVQAESELQHKNRGADKYEGLLNEEQRINEDLRFQIKNMQEKIDLQQKNEDIYKRRIEELKGEQKYFNKQIDDRSEQFEKLQQKVYDLEKQIIDQKSTVQLQQESYAQIKAQCEQYENQILEIQGEKKKVEQEYEYCINRNELLTTDLEALQKLIKDMKVGRIELEEEYIKCKLRLNNSLDTIKAKNELCKDLEIKMETYEQNHLKLTVEFQTYQNMATKEQDNLKQKISKLERELKQKVHELEVEKKQNEFSNQKIEQSNEQLEQLRKNILEITAQQRDDKFALNNQSNQINQMTSVIESEKSRNTDLIRQVTSLTSTNENLQRETKSQKVVIRELQDNHATDIEQLKILHKKEMDRYVNIEYKIHQMTYEDVLSRFSMMEQEKIRIEQYNIQLEKDLLQIQEEFKDLCEKFDLKTKTLEQTRQILSRVKKFSLQLLTNYINSDRKADQLDKQLRETKTKLAQNEKQYKQDRELLVKLSETTENKLKAEINQYKKDIKEMENLVNQKLEQIKQLQESMQLIEQMKAQQQQQMQQMMQKPLTNEQRKSLAAINQVQMQQKQQIDELRNSFGVQNQLGITDQQQTQFKQQQVNSQQINQSANFQQQNLLNVPTEDIQKNNFIDQKLNQTQIPQQFQQNQQNQLQQQPPLKPNQLPNLQQDLIKDKTKLEPQNKVINQAQKGQNIYQSEANQAKDNQMNNQNQFNQTDQKQARLQNNQQLDALQQQLQQQQRQLKQNYLGEQQNISKQQKDKINKIQQNNSFSYSVEDQQQYQPVNGSIFPNNNNESYNLRLASENIFDSTNQQFVPYHLSDFARINYSTNYNNRTFSDADSNAFQQQHQTNQFSNQKKPAQTHYTGGAYRLTQDHSKFIQGQVAKKLKQQAKENKEFGKLFRLASDHYDNSQS